MDISPRQLIALFRAGELETIMKSRSIWLCASCYACTTRCPSGIKITDVIYALKRTVMEKGYKSQAPQVQLLAKLWKVARRHAHRQLLPQNRSLETVWVHSHGKKDD
jgi:heterodisulfide reductase subunit C